MFRQLVPQVRRLSADDLDIGITAKAAAGHTSSLPEDPEVTSEHPLVAEIIRLSGLYGGVLLSGPPGTSKSYFAAAAADALTDRDPVRREFVQFHQSYQYEDFMLGFTPTEKGFEFKNGPFLRLIQRAETDRTHTYVLVIDELSRGDVGRIFGEALTYVERSKREYEFSIANGRLIRVPRNLVILGTMNPFDRGVDEVDAAFERRFAKVTMDPDPSVLDHMLDDNEMEAALRARVLAWFRRINGHAVRNPAAAVGHAYFSGVSDEASLHDLWEYQLKYVVQRAFRRDEDTRSDIETHWRHIFREAEQDVDTASVSEPSVES